MKIIKSKKLKLKIIYPLTNFFDYRGRYIQSYNKKNYNKKLKIKFVEDDFVLSKKNVFRGIHGDFKTWKLVSCAFGECICFIVNCDTKSKNFGKWEKFYLNTENYFQILIPPKFGNSYFVTSKVSIFHYKQSNYYSGQNNQFTFNYKDPKILLKLPIKNPIVSDRDKNADFFKL